jgi:beta-1,4-glucosyltransferase
MSSGNTWSEYLPLAGYPILSISAVDLGRRLGQRLAEEKKTALLFANTNFILQCQSMLAWLHSAEVILVNDGVGLDIVAGLTHGRRYQANLNGTDFLPRLFKEQVVCRKVFLYGGKPGVAEKAGLVIEAEFGQQVVGCLDGYTSLSSPAACDLINSTGAEIVLVALGNPLQEAWIRRNMKALDASLLIGVGAWFDFLSGSVQRAPRWVREIRCEWLYRLGHEPRRLMRRYTLDIGRFLLLCLRRRQMRV